MTVEQSPEHNRHVDKSIPLTWGFWWQQFKMTLPLWLFSWVCLLEMGSLKAWPAGRLSFGFVLTLLGGCLILPAFVFGMARIQIWFLHRAKRILHIKDRGISLSPARRQFVPWKQVAKFQFEPLLDLPGAKKLKLFLTAPSRRITASKPTWAMVLANPLQVQELIERLRANQAHPSATYEIQILERPEPPEPPRPFPYLGLSLGVAGMYFLLHGMQLIIVWFTRGKRESSEGEGMSPEAKGKIGQWIANHFSSVEDLDRFVLVSGVALSAVGIILLLLSWRQIRKPDLPIEAGAFHSRRG